ncbi:Uncharacterized conserved protein YgbK, DUF1537 family [Seinonella peptonophila]|uniref:Uncharacterized conserved protein YgbK, DUF1537 family n=1 Tax=Seinonella peptonophila TaxID=112248 RepID=A0A1M4Y7E5_9BACL|nr:four-carbon acid sugar kinase family protein [Seinonella peptonophila]SHF01590.1 Uncharacterized conserved protein YgbK, DUF1537 family [Seinonella peptonophila]
MNVQSELDQLIERDQRVVLILDDDPTGSQTASDVEIILDPSTKNLSAFFASDKKAVYVLTNTRAIPEEQAVSLIKKIVNQSEEIAAKYGKKIAFIQRGDSTLRGHVFPELDAMNKQEAITLFVPAFPEGGRVTVGGIHYIEQAGKRIPVNSTEFARDPVFHFRSRELKEWVDEVGNREGVLILLDELRKAGPQAVMKTLLESPTGSVVIPDAETVEDIQAIVAGTLLAEEQGLQVNIRSAATFASIRCGLKAKKLSPSPDQAFQKVLVVCGSHTELSSVQLANLEKEIHSTIIVSTEDAIRGSREIIDRYVTMCQDRFQQTKVIALATERKRLPKYHDLSSAEKIMDTMISIVRELTDEFDGLVVKGGITSAEMARKSLGVESAYVLGQIEAGVSLWELSRKGRQIPYVVVPGNIGDAFTLTRAVYFIGNHSVKAPTDTF